MDQLKQGYEAGTEPPYSTDTGAVVIGASIILFDPLFQGLAISLVLDRFYYSDIDCVVPLIYYITERKKWEKNKKNGISKL
jgi:hypothetical protein